MIEKINRWRERKAYRTYVKLNLKRKAKEPTTLKIYEMADNIRRRIGYVK